MSFKTSIIITTISNPTKAIIKINRLINEQNNSSKYKLIIIPDLKSPLINNYKFAEYVSINKQKKNFSNFSKILPFNNYARKNIGYLYAISKGAKIIIDTDDDNYPYMNFLEKPIFFSKFKILSSDDKWINVYKFFSKKKIWPRGFPLEKINFQSKIKANISKTNIFCPVQQSLANNDTDVDAIYRLVYNNKVFFKKNKKFALDYGNYCPFNSQNTTWQFKAFFLLYLPSTCSFRMTDIWRGLIAQRIMHINGWKLLFKSPTVFQIRNKHDLLNDFSQEVQGYTRYEEFVNTINSVKLKRGYSFISHNMLKLYGKLIKKKFFKKKEILILRCWLKYLKTNKANTSN